MVYLRFVSGKKARYGILDGKVVSEITPHYFGEYKKTGKKYALSKIRLLAPCEPSKVVAMGLNYIEHIREMKMSIPLQPIIFLKPSTAVIASGDKIIIPPSSKRVDFEGELAVVIKKTARHIPPKKVSEYILGYTCMNDVTARDLQKSDGQWARSKSFDTFAPLGPWIVDNINTNNLQLETYLNGVVKQKTNTSDLVFKVDEMVSFISDIMTLLPGDVISTGTPPGVGPMQPGDEVKIKIQHIGTLTNKAI